MTRSWRAKCGSKWQTRCVRPMQGQFPLPEPSILALLLICLMKMKRLCETVCNLFLGPRYELWWMYRTINYLLTLAVFISPSHMFESFRFLFFFDFLKIFGWKCLFFLVSALCDDDSKCLERGGRSDPREPPVEANPDAPQRQCGLVHAKLIGLPWWSCQ